MNDSLSSRLFVSLGSSILFVLGRPIYMATRKAVIRS